MRTRRGPICPADAALERQPELLLPPRGVRGRLNTSGSSRSSGEVRCVHQPHGNQKPLTDSYLMVAGNN
jgi:hypothetical protein